MGRGDPGESVGWKSGRLPPACWMVLVYNANRFSSMPSQGEKEQFPPYTYSYSMEKIKMLSNYGIKRKSRYFIVTALWYRTDTEESKIPRNNRKDAFEYVLNHALLRFAQTEILTAIAGKHGRKVWGSPCNIVKRHIQRCGNPKQRLKTGLAGSVFDMAQRLRRKSDLLRKDIRCPSSEFPRFTDSLSDKSKIDIH